MFSGEVDCEGEREDANMKMRGVILFYGGKKILFKVKKKTTFFSFYLYFE